MASDSLRKRLILLVVTAMVPLLAMAVFMIWSLHSYSDSYDEIVSNMTVANSYNLNFKEELDENIYKRVVQGLPFDRETGDSPYLLIGELRTAFSRLVNITTDRDSRTWLNSLLRNIDTLEERVDDIRVNLSEGGHYNENIEMLEKNIYILTELIRDDIQYYIYYQTRSIDALKTSLNRQVRVLVFWAAALLVLTLTAAVVMASVILRGITRPLENLSDVTERIARGDFDARVCINTVDEIAQVAGSVNDMASHLQVMVAQIKDDERRMRNAELRLLQEQINPHFLYNALDALVWLVEGNKTEEAVNMVVDLSDFFKLVLSGGREYISIAQEEQHIRSYLQIQQVRYRDILSYEIDFDPRLEAYQTLKLTLQPLVENALYHGLKPLRRMGHILIRGRGPENGRIVMSVTDDGVGMNAAELANLREEIGRPCSETERGFGMANVNERICMNYGPEYGLRIESEEGKGTTVTVTIPAVRH